MVLDPKFMDEQLGIDRSKIAERYRAMQEEEKVEDTQPHIPVNVRYNDPEDAPEHIPYTPEVNVKPDNVKEENRPPKLARPGKAYGQDKPIFEGGPLESEILAWKKQFGRIYMTEFEGQMFIWRPLNRFEYKEIMSIPNANEYTREEAICEVCVLFPYDYSYEHMANAPGGIPSMLAEQIMFKSGFTRKVRVIPL